MWQKGSCRFRSYGHASPPPTLRKFWLPGTYFYIDMIIKTGNSLKDRKQILKSKLCISLNQTKTSETSLKFESRHKIR